MISCRPVNGLLLCKVQEVDPDKTKKRMGAVSGQANDIRKVSIKNHFASFCLWISSFEIVVYVYI